MAGASFKRVDLERFTGTPRSLSGKIVDPGSVVAGGALQFVAASHQVHCLLFETGAGLEPNWYGVAIPAGLKDYSSVVVFFHPMPGQPGQVGYDDRVYAAKRGKWSTSLPRYIAELGFQVAASGKERVLIMPFLTKRINNDLGVFAANWKAIVEGLLAAAQGEVAPADDTVSPLFDLSLCSYSVGIKYLHTFLTKATGYRPHLREVYDFDGSFSSDSGHLAAAVRAQCGGLRHLQYGQLAVGTKAILAQASQGLIQLPPSRWGPTATPEHVHNTMSMLLCHALSTSPRP